MLVLAPGLGVLALCKATVVQVTTSARTAEGRNPLAGRVTRASRMAGGEVAVALDGGLQLVGFAGAGSILKVRSAAVASVGETAIVVAVTG